MKSKNGRSAILPSPPQSSETRTPSTGETPISSDDHLAYVRLRSPQRSGESLDVPSGEQVDQLFAANVALRSNYPGPLKTLAATARGQLLDAAICYTRRYLPESEDWIGSIGRITAELDADSISDAGPLDQRVVMAGHQPSLFHPGVWYKNFRLDALARRFKAIGINLVVDNDLMVTPSIGCPQIDTDPKTDTKTDPQTGTNSGNKLSDKHDGSDRPMTATMQLLKFDDAFATTPHEHRPIVNEDRFEGFRSVVANEIHSVIHSAIQSAGRSISDSPIVEQLWPEVLIAREKLGNECLGNVIAAGRHRLEWKLGLRTLEVPISIVSATPAFGKFAEMIFNDLENFAAIYNRVLIRYRQQHGIRSTSHPVPELATGDGFLEAPFWVWTPADRQRRPLFVIRQQKGLLLTDRKNWESQIATDDLPRWWSGEVKTGRVCIRPRALATTMFHRLMASDLFIHGIGGAKYDQLTDQIISEFFRVKPPGYLTSTATFTLPFDVDRVTAEDINREKQRLRAFRFHPENHVDLNPQTESLIRKKEAAVERLSRLQANPRSRMPEAGAEANGGLASADQRSPKKMAHDEIETINLELSGQLSGRSVELAAKIQQLKDQQKISQTLFSREYSFALHPARIVNELKSLARG